MVSGGDNWSNLCKIAVSYKHTCSKAPMDITGKALDYPFVVFVPMPTVLRGIPECKDKTLLFTCNPLSKFVYTINIEKKSTEETINKLEMCRKK